VLGDLLGDTRHFYRSPCKHVFVASEKVDELAFLFGALVGPDLDDLGRVLIINLDDFGILGNVEGSGHGGDGRVGRRGRCIGSQLLQLGGSDRGHGQLDVALFAVQCSLGLGLYGVDISRPWYLQLEVGVVGDGHELDITLPPQDDVVRSGTVDHLEGEHLGAVVVHVSKSGRQTDLLKGDGLLAWDHSIEWVQAGFGHVLAQPQPLEGVEVHEVEVAASIHEGLSEPGHSD
jgi:hypothetical protein